jgi:predicted PolB exonuclease-like 3'-5' exonuclease
MAYNPIPDYAITRGPLVFDIETAPLPNASDYLDPVEAAKNLKDPVKIAADIAERAAEQLGKCALDPNVARIVCIGTWHLNQGVVVDVLQCDADEREALKVFWRLADGRRLVGFRCREFDLPMLIQRSRYLGVKAPSVDLGRYSRGDRLTDLYDILTFQDSQRTFAMRRSLQSFARRVGLPLPADMVNGADVPALVAAGDWKAVGDHCRADVDLTVALAEWLGCLPKVVDGDPVQP